MDKKQKGKNTLRVLKEYAIITFGLLCYTLAWVVFLIPNRLVGGGITGLGVIVQYATGFNVSYFYFIVNSVLLVIGLKVLGNRFGIKTVYAVIVASLLLRFLPLIISEQFIREIALQNGKLLCTIIGGALSGFGIALTFTQGGSTGGTDIIALIVNKYRSIQPGRMILIMDVFIIASSLLIPDGENFGSKIATIVYGYIMTGVLSYVCDLTLSGSRQSVQIVCLSKKYAEIADRIIMEEHRGVTVLNGEGWYTKEESKVLMVVVRKAECNRILNIIKEIDRNAFLSVGSVTGVYGKGFDTIKK
ncbi:MAG: YitT family protein [Bacteroidales bacterium]|jgi:uncharacterized membrane-anchored protein YitT (DUF2179 family)|nr:YitT family protein [Bacteroidales bacterium]MCI2122217.1 YitT family protein [Bacteroidales bacterium]MCI2145553.1 YitT family protein [Bacteroidales bacterium]